MLIKRPDFLKPGDTIGIAATARWIEQAHVDRAIELFHRYGWNVKLADNVFEHHFQLAGNAERRRSCFQKMLDDSELSAIIVGRGGYGTVEILDSLDWGNWLNKPSWICGYSDVTALLCECYSHGVSSIHSTMPVSFHDATEIALEQLCQALSGSLDHVEWKTSMHGSANIVAPLVGGNLSVLYSLLGSSSYPKGPAILFLEDVDEMVYHIHRMTTGLLRAGALEHIKAIVLGGFSKMRDNTIACGFPSDNPWGQTSLEAIVDITRRLNIPVIDGLPAGHLSDNRAFYHGQMVRLEVEKGRAQLTWGV